MYLRTPKRYRRGRRRSFSFGRLLIWILVPVLIVVGIGIYENREMFAPEVNRMMVSVISDVGDGIEQINAPAPTATPDPTNDIELANNAWANGRIQQAVDAYQRAVASTPNDVLVHYRLAFGLIMQGKFQQALVAAEDTITANPFESYGWAIRAMALNRIGDYTEALASANHALTLASPAMVAENPDLAPARARALAFQAEAYLNLEQPERARAAVDQALEVYPESPEALQVSGQVWEGPPYYDFDAARVDYADAHEIAPEMLYITIWLARVERWRFENTEYAVELYQQIIESNPGNGQALLDLGEYYYRVDNDFNRAAEMFSRCVDENPQNALCQWWLGRNLIALEQQNSALEPLRTATELDPDNGYPYFWLGRAYIDLGQCPQAVPALEESRRIGEQTDDQGLIDSANSLLSTCGAAPGLIPAPGTEATPEVP